MERVCLGRGGGMKQIGAPDGGEAAGLVIGEAQADPVRLGRLSRRGGSDPPPPAGSCRVLRRAPTSGARQDSPPRCFSRPPRPGIVSCLLRRGPPIPGGRVCPSRLASQRRQAMPWRLSAPASRAGPPGASQAFAAGGWMRSDPLPFPDVPIHPVFLECAILLPMDNLGGIPRRAGTGMSCRTNGAGHSPRL